MWSISINRGWLTQLQSYICGENTEEVHKGTLSKKAEESLSNRSPEEMYSPKVSTAVLQVSL